MTNKQSWGNNWDWENELLVLCEKYCKHDDGEYNSCLWHIFHPFIKKLFTSKAEQMEGLFKDCERREDSVQLSDVLEILKK